MIERISGKAKFICSQCGHAYSLENEDFFFEAVSGSERGMGQETLYSSEYDLTCDFCNNEIHIEFEIWEYPAGLINHTDHNASGASNVESGFEFIYAPDDANPEEENNRVVGAVAGGAILGASLGGPVGAFIGGVIGGLLGDSVNKSKKEGKK